MANFLPIVQDGGGRKQLPAAETLVIRDKLDIESGGTMLFIGDVNATGLTLGKVGVTTTVAGDLGVTGAAVVTGNSTFNEDIVLGDASEDIITMLGRWGSGASPDLIFTKEVNHQIRVDASDATTVGATLGILGGQGGDATLVAPGGGGGNLSLTGAAGGAGEVGQAAGIGASVAIAAGGAGALNGGTGAAGGNLSLDAGLSTLGANGTISVGTANTSALTLGMAASTISQTAGGGQVSFTGNVDMGSGADITGTLTVGGVNHQLAASGAALMVGDGAFVTFGLNPLTTAERVALTEVKGMVVYDGDTSSIWISDGAANNWSELGISGSVGTGTPESTWIINNNAAGGADETTSLEIRSSLIAGAVLNHGFWALIPHATAPVLEYVVDDNTNHVASVICLGDASGEALNLDPALQFRGSNNLTDIRFDSSAGDLLLGTGATSVSSVVPFDAENGLDVTTAALTAAAALTVTGGAFTFSGSNINLDPTGSYNLSMDDGQPWDLIMGVGAASKVTISIADAIASSFLLEDAGGDDYILISTAAGTEAMSFGNTGDNPDINFLGSGPVTFGTGTVSMQSSTGVNVPNGAEFLINSVALGVGWTAGNMNTLLAGPTSDASALHTHDASGVITGLDTDACAVGDVCYIDAAGDYIPSDADNIATCVPAGVVLVVHSTAGIIQTAGKVTLNAETGILDGERLYLSAASGVGTAGRVCGSGDAEGPTANPGAWVEVGVAMVDEAANSLTAIWRVVSILEL